MFEKSLDAALTLIFEDLENRIELLVGQVNKLDKKGSAKERAALDKFRQDNNLQEPEEIIRSLAQYDPSGTEDTPKGTYVGWILTTLSTGQIRLPEDGSKVRNALTIFDKYKKTKRWEGETDINQYVPKKNSSFSQLESITRKFQAELSQAGEPSSIRKWVQWVERQGVEPFYKDERFEVLKFDASEFMRGEGQGHEKITHEVEVVPRKLMLDKGGKEIEVNWVPIWADENYKTTIYRTGEQRREWPPMSAEESGEGVGYIVTPTAMALSRLATGTALCVANPVAGQNWYLNKGPLYAMFKDNAQGENVMYLLSNHVWDEFMNDDNDAIVVSGSSTAYFMAKMIINKHEELGGQAVRNIATIIKRSIAQGKIRTNSYSNRPSSASSTVQSREQRMKKQTVGAWNSLQPPVQTLITKAINLGYPDWSFNDQLPIN
jgi:hypothetical protein